VLRGKNPTEAVRVVLGRRRSPEKKRRREDVCEFRLVCRGPDVLIYRGHGRIDNRAGRGGGDLRAGNRKLPGSFAHAEAADRLEALAVGVDAKACTRRNKICAEFTLYSRPRLGNQISPQSTV
jgi:hypothetical protein